MDNQHKLIKGYRDLSQVEIDLMNEVKAKGQECCELVIKIGDHITSQYSTRGSDDTEASRHLNATRPLDWLQQGTSEMQTAFMKLVRSIAQPTIF